jgi:hypothetical protein
MADARRTPDPAQLRALATGRFRAGLSVVANARDPRRRRMQRHLNAAPHPRPRPAVSAAWRRRLMTATPTVAPHIAALPKLSTRPQPSPRNIHMYKPLDALATKPLLRRALSAEVQQGKTQALTPGGSVAPCCTTLRGRQAS